MAMVVKSITLVMLISKNVHNFLEVTTVTLFVTKAVSINISTLLRQNINGAVSNLLEVLLWTEGNTNPKPSENHLKSIRLKKLKN